MSAIWNIPTDFLAAIFIKKGDKNSFLSLLLLLLLICYESHAGWGIFVEANRKMQSEQSVSWDII